MFDAVLYESEHRHRQDTASEGVVIQTEREMKLAIKVLAKPHILFRGIQFLSQGNV